MKVRFWGVRGSIPTPGERTVKYGGNTSCIEIRGDEDEILIIDAGTGLRELGNFLVANDLKKGALDLNICLTHTHWDHIQGFPFFAPAFIASSKIQFMGPVNAMGMSLKDVVAGQMSYSYFPIKLSELTAELKFKELKEGEFQLGKFNIKTCYLNHPILCLGYRVSYNDKVVVTVYDNEPYRNIFATNQTNGDEDSIFSEIDQESIKEAEYYVQQQNQRIYDFAKGASLLIFDAQYTKEEYKNKVGWGHGSIDDAIYAGLYGRVNNLALFHHDPTRSDKDLDRLQLEVMVKVSSLADYEMRVFFARERLEIEL